MAFYNNVIAGAAGASGDAYKIERSLRFTKGDGAHLYREITTKGNTKTFTFSCWLKKTRTGLIDHNIFSGSTGTNTGAYFCFPDNGANALGSADCLSFKSDPGAGGGSVETDAVFRDLSAWYHIVLAVDTTQATASDRVKIWVNGVSQSLSISSSPGYPNQDSELSINDVGHAAIGAEANGSSSSVRFHGDFYLAEIHFLDGTAVSDASDFGQYDSNNVWQPKEVSGVTYGTNGYYLDFSDNSSNSALGTDSSGASNNWTVNNLTAQSVTGPSTGASWFFDGSSSLHANDSSLALGSGDWTVEYFLLPWNNYSNQSTHIGYHGNNPFFETDGVAKVRWMGAAVYGSSLAYPNWYHIAYVKDGGQGAMWVNGTRIATNLTVGSNFTKTELRIGQRINETVGTRGLLSNVHIVVGTAKYKRSQATIPIPHTPIPVIADTKLLALSTSTLTEDASGNNITLTAPSSGITVNNPPTIGETIYQDSLIDSPTNYDDETNIGGNYATLNVLDSSSNITFSNGNLHYTHSTSGHQMASSTIAVNSGKWYIEVTPTAIGSSYTQIGISPTNTSNFTYTGNNGYSYAHNGSKYGLASGSNYGSSYAANDVIGIAFDADGGNLYFYKNGVAQNSGTAAFTGIDTSKHWRFSVSNYNSGTGSVNFGQHPFRYPPGGTGGPSSDYKSLCTTNLDDPLIEDPSTAFDAVLYTGDGNSTQTITGLNFAPDLTWQKIRNQAGDHALTDIVRGVDAGYLQSEDSDAEKGNADNGVSAFTSDGFTVKGSFNSSSNNWVTWAWDAGSSNTTISAGSLNSSIYDRSKPWSSLVTTSTLHNSYNYGGPNSKIGCFDGKQTTSMYSAGGPLTITFDASAFPASGGPYFVEVETNQRGIKVNGQPSSGYTTDIAPNQATYFANNGSVSSLTSIEINQASGAYGGMCNRIRVNGKVLADSINTSVTWSNALSGLANSSLTNPANAFNGDDGSYADSTAGFTLDLSGHTFGTGTHTIEVKSGGASSFTVNGSTSLSGSGSGAIVWSGTHTGELTSLASSATGASVYYIKVDGEYLLDPGQDFVQDFPAVASTCRTNQNAGISIVSYQGTGSRGSVGHNLNAQPHFIMLKNRSGATSWAIQHVGTTLGQGLLKLNNNNAVATNVAYPVWMSTAPTSSVFSVGTSSDTNGNGNDYIAYCFSPVESYSAFGSFEGDGQNEGPFVYTGFKPAFLLVKSADTTYDWFIYDTARQSYNEQGPDLRANRNYAEQNNPRFDFLSNGFKVHTSSVANNANAVTYIYAAFAEHPFKTARAR